MNKAPFTILLTSPGLAHTANNFAPNEYRGVANSPDLVVYKGSTQEIKVELKVKTESKLKGVNSDVKMDRGPVIFTSDVSSQKTIKVLAR